MLGLKTPPRNVSLFRAPGALKTVRTGRQKVCQARPRQRAVAKPRRRCHELIEAFVRVSMLGGHVRRLGIVYTVLWVCSHDIPCFTWTNGHHVPKHVIFTVSQRYNFLGFTG